MEGKKCSNKYCQKRHIKTCRYWFGEGCQRNKTCAYLHQDTYESIKKLKLNVQTKAAETKDLAAEVLIVKEARVVAVTEIQVKAEELEKDVKADRLTVREVKLVQSKEEKVKAEGNLKAAAKMKAKQKEVL